MLFASTPQGLDALFTFLYYIFTTFWGTLVYACCLIPGVGIENPMQYFLFRNFRVKLNNRQSIMFSALLLFVLIAPWVAMVFSDKRATVGHGSMALATAHVWMVEGILFFGIWLLAVNSRGFLPWMKNSILVLFFAAFALAGEMTILTFVPSKATL